MSNHDECAIGQHGMAGFYKMIQDQIDRKHWLVIATEVVPFTPCEYDVISLSYTVGLMALGQPEVIIYGLRPDVAHYCANEAGAALKAGRLQLDTPLEGFVARFPVVFKKVQPDLIEGIFGLIRDHSPRNREVDAIQMIWTDMSGKFPWDAGFDEGQRCLQPAHYRLLN